MLNFYRRLVGESVSKSTNRQQLSSKTRLKDKIDLALGEKGKDYKSPCVLVSLLSTD